MAQRFSQIGRESAVRKQLDKMPEDLNDLYRLTLHECGRGRSKEEFAVLKRLFAWLAFSKRSLTLAEASDLGKLTDKTNVLDVEEELIGRSSRFVPRLEREDSS